MHSTTYLSGLGYADSLGTGHRDAFFAADSVLDSSASALLRHDHGKHDPLNDIMTTPLDRPMKRELELDGVRYTVTISPEGIKVTEKGKRKGQEITWRDIISGDAALRRDLSLSVGALQAE